jgi:hypothetical protein
MGTGPITSKLKCKMQPALNHKSNPAIRAPTILPWSSCYHLQKRSDNCHPDRRRIGRRSRNWVEPFGRNECHAVACPDALNLVELARDTMSFPLSNGRVLFRDPILQGPKVLSILIAVDPISGKKLGGNADTYQNEYPDRVEKFCRDYISRKITGEITVEFLEAVVIVCSTPTSNPRR